MEGKCKKKDCNFLHLENACKHYYQNKCKFGNKCKFSHDFDINKKKKNTQSFDPDLSEPDLRLKIQTDGNKFYGEMKENDVVILPKFFKDNNIYQKLLDEMKNTNIDNNKLWKLWHGDTHLIADDKLKDNDQWKNKCPTFNFIIDKMKDFFDMDVKATRFNHYRDNTDWKPYHHDAAAVDPKKAKTQNFTVAVSFGSKRIISFQHAKTKNRIDIPIGNGSVYTFGKQVNIDWMHGIIKEPENKKEGRISIIMWGKNNQIKISCM